MGARRGLATAVALLVIGSAVALVVGQATWVRVSPLTGALSIDRPGLHVDVQGADAAALVVPLAVLGLAGAVGLLATRGWFRRVLGGLLALAGLGIVVQSGRVLADPRAAVAGVLRRQSIDAAGAAAAGYDVVAVWPLLAALGGVLVIVGGVLAVVGSRDWPAMGTRFEAPARTSGPGRPVDPWTALDRGEDPTAGSTPAVTPGAAPSDPEVPE